MDAYLNRIRKQGIALNIIPLIGHNTIRAAVLIVDDDDAIRLLYEEELTYEGYEVVTSDDWEGLLETIAQKKSDLIVLEAEIGKFSGLNILKNIRSTYYDMFVILSTVYAALKFNPRCISSDYCVVKSSDLHELKLRINMAMETICRSRKEKNLYLLLLSEVIFRF
jgi:DNA-binding NtrC family response regulator